MKKIKIPPGAREIISRLADKGFDAYVVGGCVRDSLMELIPHDWDICTAAKPKEILDCFRDRKVIETGLKHGTITVVMDDGSYEVTTFRIDGTYSDNRRPDSVTFVHDIVQDLARRDFTMNAMAYNDTAGVIDPFGGMSSIHDGIISCVGNPDTRFREDALRVLRALRFASVYNMRISEETAMSIHDNKALLGHVSAERICSELCKLLPGNSILSVLLEYGDVMATIIPELGPCIGFEQNNRFHQYTVYEHIAHAVANYKGGDVTTLMALLLHDIGKPLCYTEDENGGHFLGHADLSESLAKAVVSRLRFDSKKQHDIVELVLYHDTIVAPTPRSVKRMLNKVGEEQFFRLMDIRLADILAHAEGTQDTRIEQRNAALELATSIIKESQCFSIKDLAVNGNDVKALGIPEGPQVGRILHALLEAVMDGTVQNERTCLLRQVVI